MPSTITKEANGTTIEAKVGAPIHIQLNGNPTTGYAWAPKNPDNSKYETVVEYKAPHTGMMGAGGVYHITVTPKQPGTYPAEFAYARSFESDKPPAETFSVTMNAS